MEFRILWVILTIGISGTAARSDKNQSVNYQLSDWELGDSFEIPVKTCSLKGKAVVILMTMDLKVRSRLQPRM